MEQANIPKQEELNALYGSWNPGAYMRGFENQGLADQFRQQAFEANQQGMQKTQQEYAQNELMNPLRVEALKGTNLGQANTNIKTGLEAERLKANQPYTLSKDLRDQALEMTDSQFKQADQHIESLLRSQNPEEQKLGLKLQSTLPSMLAEKRKNDQAMALQKEQTRSHLAGIGAQTASNEKLEGMRIEAGKYAKSTRGTNTAQSIIDSVTSGKTSYEKAATAFHTAAQFTEDVELAAKYEKLASEFEQMQKNKPIDVKAGSVDTAAIANLPTRDVPSVINPPATPAKPLAPARALSHLQQYPEQAAAFKAKYGYLP